VKSSLNRAAVYGLLAVVATLANLVSQEAVLRAGLTLAAAVAVGTAVGLLVKYELDKRFIFRFRACNIGHNARTFVLYAGAGVVTTGIFWGAELAAHALVGGTLARNLGAAAGLALGYYVKYQLDLRYVFRSATG